MKNLAYKYYRGGGIKKYLEPTSGILQELPAGLLGGLTQRLTFNLSNLSNGVQYYSPAIMTKSGNNSGYSRSSMSAEDLESLPNTYMDDKYGPSNDWYHLATDGNIYTASTGLLGNGVKLWKRVADPSTINSEILNKIGYSALKPAEQTLIIQSELEVANQSPQSTVSQDALSKTVRNTSTYNPMLAVRIAYGNYGDSSNRSSRKKLITPQVEREYTPLLIPDVTLDNTLSNDAKKAYNDFYNIVNKSSALLTPNTQVQNILTPQRPVYTKDRYGIYTSGNDVDWSRTNINRASRRYSRGLNRAYRHNIRDIKRQYRRGNISENAYNNLIASELDLYNTAYNDANNYYQNLRNSLAGYTLQLTLNNLLANRRSYKQGGKINASKWYK